MNVINDLVLYTLTEEENKEFERKVNLLEDFCKTFNKKFYFRNIVDSFTQKEILSSNMSNSNICSLCDLPRPVLKRIETISYDINRYLKQAVEVGIFEESKLTNLRSDVLDASTDKLYVEPSQFFNMFGRGQDTLNDILNKDKTHLFDSGSILAMIDNTVANYEYDEDFAEKVLTAYPNYTGFILSIVNENISKERKLSILKKSFRQKDFNSYIETFGAKLKNYDDLDLFIDTVILNNNRIKNKDSNLWNAFKRVFIGKKGRESRYPSVLLNKDAFFNKYSKILTADKLVNLVQDMYVDYYLRNNLESLIKDMYSSLSLDEKLDYAIKCKYFDTLFSNDLVRLFNENNNSKTRNRLINYYKTHRNSRASLADMAEAFGGNFVEYLNDNFVDSEYDVSFLNIETYIAFDKIKFYNLLSDDIFNRIVFYKNHQSSSLFIENRCDYNSKEKINRIKQTIEYFLENGSPSKQETIYKKFFSVFEDEDTFSNLTCLFSDVISKKRQDIISSFSGGWYTKTDPIQYMLETVSWFENIFIKKYPSKTDVIASFNDLRIGIDLLMNI